MLEAEIEGQIIRAGPGSPEVARCPACGGTVSKRKRRRMDGRVTYFYRHNTAEGIDCPLRYTPVSVER